MSDALLSPAVGGVMWGASAIGIAYSSSKLKKELDSEKVPLMGALGAFVFAAQMINFTIPATGSSGHLGGALLLAILLGPYAAFLVMVSVLVVQALFFADGGILALGANIFNMGFYACFLAYPLIYRPLAGQSAGTVRVFVSSIIAAVTALTLGALSVVIETTLSGISSLPFGPFAAMMIPVHIAIGIVEGVVTGVVVVVVSRAQTASSLIRSNAVPPSPSVRRRRVVIGILVAAVVIGGIFSWFASSHPDGLEWSVAAVAKNTPPEESASKIQGALSFLPDYGFRKADGGNGATTVAGLVGGAITLAAVLIIGVVLKRRTKKRAG
jgi:cobalt/nickel transport system permease protein